MSDNVTSIFLAFFVVCLPVWICLHYIAKMRGSRQLNAQDASAFEALSQTAARMESRILQLERILDAEVPGWRQTSAPGVRDHEQI
jgi:phage shock protein B